MSGHVTMMLAPWSDSQLANSHTIPPAPSDFEYIRFSQDLLVLNDNSKAKPILLKALLKAVGKDPSVERQPPEHNYNQQERAQSRNLTSTTTKSQSEGDSAYCCPLSTRYGTDTLSAARSILRGECYHDALANVASVHEHLLKKHGRPKHCCGRCYQTFTSEELRKAHLVNGKCSVRVFRFSFRLGEHTIEAIAAYPGTESQTETARWSEMHPSVCPSSPCLPSPFSRMFKYGIPTSRDVGTQQDVAPLSSPIAKLASSPTSLSVSSLLPSDSIHALATFNSLDCIPVGGDYTLQGRNFPGLRETAFVAPNEGAGLLSSSVGYQFAGINVDLSISAQQEQHSQAGSLVEHIVVTLSAHAASKCIRQCTGRAAGSRSSSGVQETDSTRSGKRAREEEEGDDISLPGGGDEDNDDAGYDPPPPGSQSSTVDVDEEERALQCPLCLLYPIEGYVEKPINDPDKLRNHIWDVHDATMSQQAKDNLRGLFGKKHFRTKNESCDIRRWRAITTAVTGLSEAEQGSPYHPTLRKNHKQKPQAGMKPRKQVKTSTQVATLSSASHHTMLATDNHNGLGSIATESQLKETLDSKIAAIKTSFQVKIGETTGRLIEEMSATIKELYAEYWRNTEQVSTQLSYNPSQGASLLAPSYSHVVSNACMSAAGSGSFNMDARFPIRGGNASASSAHGQDGPTVSEGVQLPRTVAQPSYRRTSSSSNLQPASEANDAESANDNFTLVNSEPGNQAFPGPVCIECKFDPLTGYWQFCESCKLQFGFSTF